MVFNLPSIDAATTLPFCPDIILHESTTISRDIITTGITIDIAPSYARIINKPFTNNLSAMASITLPKSVTKLYLRAIYPSNESDRDAIRKIIPAIMYLSDTLTLPICHVAKFIPS